MTHRGTTSLRPGWLDELGTVRAAMTRSVIAVAADVPAIEALTSMYRSGVGGAPVVEHGRVEGVVTTADLLAPRSFARETGPFLRPWGGALEWRVRDLMTASPLTASPDEPLIDAVIRMARAHVDRLPVVDTDGRPIGIVARDDVIRVLSRVAARRHTRIPARRPVLVPD